MSRIHVNSQFGLPAHLDIFSLPPTQITDERSVCIPHYPISQLESGPIEFSVPSSQFYTDLNALQLYIKCQIVKGDGSLYEHDNAEITPNNALLHSLFSKVDVHLGNKLITDGNDNYHLKAWLETVVGLNQTQNSGKARLANIMFYTKTPFGDQMRIKRTANSKIFELQGSLQIDFFKQAKYLINYVPIQIRLHKATPQFYLETVDSDSPTIKILRAILFTKHIQVSPIIELAHAKTLQSSNALYHYKRRCIEVASIPSGMQIFSVERPFHGKIPRKLFLSTIPTEARAGSYLTNSLKFANNGVSCVELSINGEMVAGTPLSVNFENDQYVAAYESFYKACDETFGEIDISYDEYKSMYCIFGFDLSTGHRSTNGSYVELVKSGVIRITIKFSTTLASPLNVVMMGELDQVLEITNNREVLIQ